MTESPYATFLRARWDELEAVAQEARDERGYAVEGNLRYEETGYNTLSDLTIDPGFVLDDIAAKRKILDWHENWPVLVEQKAPPLTPSHDSTIDSMTFQLSSRIHWATEREYVKQFGTAPPTSPILVMLAEPFRAHPDHPANQEATR